MICGDTIINYNWDRITEKIRFKKWEGTGILLDPIWIFIFSSFPVECWVIVFEREKREKWELFLHVCFRRYSGIRKLGSSFWVLTMPEKPQFFVWISPFGLHILSIHVFLIVLIFFFVIYVFADRLQMGEVVSTIPSKYFVF